MTYSQPPYLKDVDVDLERALSDNHSCRREVSARPLPPACISVNGGFVRMVAASSHQKEHHLMVVVAFRTHTRQTSTHFPSAPARDKSAPVPAGARPFAGILIPIALAATLTSKVDCHPAPSLRPFPSPLQSPPSTMSLRLCPLTDLSPMRPKRTAPERKFWETACHYFECVKEDTRRKAESAVGRARFPAVLEYFLSHLNGRLRENGSRAHVGLEKCGRIPHPRRTSVRPSCGRGSDGASLPTRSLPRGGRARSLNEKSIVLLLFKS